jgi:predicted DNA binding CopG/RHH family protein
MKSTKLKPIPKFKEEKQEQAFWQNADSTDYIDWSKAKPAAFVNLKPSTTTISIRLPQSLLDSIKLAANSQDVPYQSLIKIWLKERVGA